MDDAITLALRWITLNEVAWPNEVQIARALLTAHERIKELEAELISYRVPPHTWRGACGHLWDRTIEDTEECPRCKLEAKQSWRPIESAPRDGNQILAWVPLEPGHSMGHYRVCWLTTEGWTYFGINRSIEPTHWMPLPEPPK